MKKRILSALLTSCMVLTLLPVSVLAAPANETGAQFSNTATSEQEQTEIIMKIQFSCDGKVVKAGDFFVPEGVQNYSVLKKYVPEGYQMTASGDFMAEADALLLINVEKIAPEAVIMNIQFKDGDEVVAGGDYFVPAGVQNYSVLEQYVPTGYRMTVSGDFMAEDGGKLEIGVEKVMADTDVIMNIAFKTADGTFVAGGDYFVPAGVQNYSVLEQYVPEGYEMTVSGDFMAEDGGKLVVNIEKISTDVIMNIQFKCDDEVVAGGDYFVPAGVQNYSVLEQYVPEGYEMTVSGDFMAEDGGKLVVNIEKISTDVIMNIRFVLADGTFVAGGDYFLPEGIQNMSILEQYVPEGYEMMESGDFTVTAGGQEDITVEKISEDVIMNIRFVLADGTFVAGGDYFLPEGIQNMSILEQYVPEGYEMMESGDFTVTAGGQEDITVEKISEDVIMNIRFVLADGTFVAGGDYFLPEGIQNMSILEQYVPEGYEMMESGDFTVTAGGQEDITVEKISEDVIMNIRFVLADGTFVAGGDYFLPEGIQNMSILEQYVPEGYEMMESGDFTVTAGGQEDITVEKISEDVIMNIRFVLADGTFVAGGDYFLPEGIQNMSILEQYVPEGYEMMESGDFTVTAGGQEDITVEKISEDVIMNIRFVLADGTFVAGGDYFLPEGIQNMSILEQYVPEGYEMMESGDFTVTAGGQEDITVEKISEDVIMNIRFVLADGTFVAGGDYFLPEGIQNMSILEQYVPEGYEMMESGDFTVTAGGQEDITVEKISEDVIMNIRFVLADGTFVAGGDYFLPEGIQNMSILEQYVPEGYEMMESGDFTVTAGGQEDITVEKISEDVIMNIRFVLADGTFVAGGDYFLPEGIQNMSILEQYVPEGYEMMESGDFTVTAGGQEDITVEKISEDVIMNIRFVLADGTFVAGGDYFLPEGIQNMSILEQYVPEGYEMMESGDFTVTAGGQEDITVEKISEDVIMNIRFVLADGTFVAGGDYFLPEGIQNMSILEQYVPEGYEMMESGDFTVTAGGQEDITVEKISEDVIMNIRFVLADGTFVAGGDYFLPEGIQNMSILEQYVPEGYEMMESGDFTVTAGGQEDITVEKISEDVIMNIRFVLADGTFVAGGDYFLPEGIQNMSILEQYVPEGYEMMESGDFTVTAGGQEDITVEKISEDVIMNIRFVLADGTFVAGGDYFLPEGIQNMSILEQYVPEGYEMMESGDFTVTAGGQEDITVEKISEDVIMNIRFVLADGTFVAGGDYFLPEGIQNMSILEQYVPEGYEMMESGDFTVTAGGQEDITVEKISEDVIMKIRFVTVDGEFVAGGDYFLPEGIQNFEILEQYLPEGFKLMEFGDFFVTDGGKEDVTVEEIKSTIPVNVRYWDTVNNTQVGESFTITVDADATSVNTSTFKDIPAGYELVWEGDLQINDGWVWVEVRPVEAPPVEKTFTVTFDSNGGSAVASQTVKEGEKAAKPANPTRDGYTFEGWFADEALKTAYDFNTPVTSDITLYADWDRRSSGGGGGGGSSSTKKYIITVTCGEGGEITPDGGSDNEVEVRKGNDQTFRISADNGYRISDVLVDGESVGNVDKYTFEDVDEDHKIEAIFTRRAADPSDSGTDRYLNTKDHVQYMTGYPDGSFGPGQNMTRAEAAQMFYALLLDQNVPHTVSFSDVPADAWYAEAVNTLASLGMINGYPDGTFRPDAPITRAEFCVIALAFAYEPEDFDCDFRDVSTSDWFYDYVAQATSYGWISGADRSFRPNECITRAEVSVIVNNMLGRVADEDYIDRHEDELNTFPDVKPSHWAYYSIMETANSHDYTKNNGNENWR